MLRSLARLVRPALAAPIKRTLASAAESELISPPLRLFGLDGRYAHALFSAASKKGSVEAVESELMSMKGALAENARLNQWVTSPGDRKQKARKIVSALRELKLSPTTTNFFGVLAENGRLRELSNIINGYQQLMSSHRGEILATVTTTLREEAIEPETKAAIEAQLRDFAPDGKLIVTYKYDEEIGGGIIMRVGDMQIDMSERTLNEQFIRHINQPLDD
eukprot:TRINITY_DN6960_c0_g1_i1.p1 TRINITY_DN6960_c0_g1~~TRINITY_DN6960_c0_g1_i1.p1  ORF type:complete len:220 (+),score=58.78 TRINITY_DN6960_c0_g1_i1:53-712(+)